MAQFADFDEVRRLGRKSVEVKIREAGKRDVAALAKLVALFEGGEPACYEDGFERELKLWAGTEMDHLLVAELEGEVVGFARAKFFEPKEDAPPNCAPPGYYLSGVVVDPAQRRRGIAALLAEQRLDWIRRRASKAYSVVAASNRASLALQERLGFRELPGELVYPGLDIEEGKRVVQVLELKQI